MYMHSEAVVAAHLESLDLKFDKFSEVFGFVPECEIFHSSCQ
jgi:hypothetical protein